MIMHNIKTCPSLYHSTTQHENVMSKNGVSDGTATLTILKITLRPSVYERVNSCVL
jgi:hypothetical protein